MNHYQNLDHFALDQSLSNIGTGISASEAHGIICGVACVPDAENTSWVGEIIDGSDPEIDSQACVELLVAVFESTREQLYSANFEFEPLLPDDDEALVQRGIALGEWCTGFLFGLTLAGTISLESLPKDSREVVADLTKFATIRATDSEGEEEEAAFLELVEYIRIGVILISEDFYEAAHKSLSTTLH